MIDTYGLFAMIYGLMAGLIALTMAFTYSRGALGSPLERAFFAFSAATAIWNAAYAAMSLTNDPDTVRLIYRAGSFAWALNPSFAMYYAYRLYCHYAVRPLSRPTVALIFAPAPFFIFGIATGRLLAVDFARSDFGWLESVDPSSWWNYAFILVLLAGLAAFTIIGVRLIRVSRTNRARLHGRLITFPIAAIIVLVLAFHIVLPMLGEQPIPPVVQCFIALWVVAIALFRDRYPVLSLSPRIAAEAIVNSMSDLCALVDDGGILRGANPAIGDLLGFDPRDAVGREACGTLPQEFCEVLKEARASSDGRCVREVSVATASGSLLPCMVTAGAIQDTLDDAVGFVLVAREIREEKRLQLLSETDGLTGAFNRRKMEELMEASLLDPRKGSRPLSVIMIDIDHFKRVNDAFGHEAGDKTIVEFCSIIRNSVRGNDQFARWGGEEFVVLCCDTEAKEAAVLAERIRLRTAGHAFPHGGKVTASFGIAEVRGDDGTDSLVRRADEAMYASKAAGRNRVTIASGV